MIKIPLETFSYRSQSGSIIGPEMVRHSKWNKEGKESEFTKYIDKDASTVFEAFRCGATKSHGGFCLGWRNTQVLPFQWMTYNETLLRAQNFGCGLLSMGLTPGEHSMVGIYARNCPEWVIVEQGLFCYSMVSVPFYDSLGLDVMSFIIAECGIRIIVAFDEVNVKTILETAPPPCLKVIVTIRDARPETVQQASSLGIKVTRFSEVEKCGALKKEKEVPPYPETTATICFSSITTSVGKGQARPKGVMLSHENIVSATSACVLQLGFYAPRNSDVLFSYLPLAHTLERCCELSVLMAGGSIGFYSGNLKTFSADVKTLKPTILPMVPRVLNRMYDECVTVINKNRWLRGVFNVALSSKTEEIFKGIVRRTSLWDRLLFWFVRQKIGGNVRLMIVGSAPLAGNVLTFMRAATGCIIVEGYGQTECVAPCTLTVAGDPQPGHVGPPVPCNLVKLVDVPEMEYFSSQGQGEVCVWGPNVFQGYFREPERTAQVLDHEGWLHTGDIGEWLANGTLKIIDRKKQIFKLSQGEYVAPDRIETIYLQSNYIAQVFVHGDSLKSSVVAVVVPDVAAVKAWASHKGIPSDSLSSLCNNRELKNFIMEEIRILGESAQLHYYEKVAAIYLHPDLFSLENGLLSNTGGLRRQKMAKYFNPQLEGMYKKLT